MRPPWQMLKSRQKNSADDGCSGYRPGWIPDVDLLRIGRIYGLAGYNWKLTHIKVHIAGSTTTTKAGIMPGVGCTKSGITKPVSNTLPKDSR